MVICHRFTGIENQLLETAVAATGFEDFGSETQYLPGLTALLDGLDHGTPQFAQGGREFVFGSLVGVLVARLTAQRGLRERPEVLTHSIARPLIITGVPRTGTTALHKLLSVDEQFQGLARAVVDRIPQPGPPRRTWESKSSYQATVAGIEAFFTGAPTCVPRMTWSPVTSMNASKY